MVSKIKLIYLYLKDKQVPFYKKALILGSLLYFILPVDLIPDFILGIGWVDDLLVLIFVVLVLKKELGEYQNKLDRMKFDESKVIDMDSVRKKKD